MSIQPAALLIADIGGYTRFMREHRFSLAHAQDAVGRLLERVIAAARPLRLAKLEGDAAFLWRPLDRPGDVTDLARVIPEMDAAFLAERGYLGDVEMCSCDACRRVGELRLKFVAHVGEVGLHKVARRTELAGVDVILLHRMLKNDVQLAEYVLVTEPALAAFDETQRGLASLLEHDFEGLGKTRTFFLDLAAIRHPVRPARRPSIVARLWHKVKLETRSVPYLVGAKEPCAAFRNVEIVSAEEGGSPADPS